MQRIYELVQNARKIDSEVEVREVPLEKGELKSFWKQAVRAYDYILYVSQDGNVNELKDLQFRLQRGREGISTCHMFRASRVIRSIRSS